MVCRSRVGRDPVATIVPTGDMPLADLEASLRDLCRRELAGYKQPRRFEFRSDMPLGPAGKILKRELKDKYGSTSPE
ncbi:MAG: hypothetical protein OXC29_06270 [Rhodococcus sp.]|nr:hypothetical protein [Rhodococcus sp. (in: high G+C Gram-positive bacteria)]